MHLPTPYRLTLMNGQVDGLPNRRLWGSFEGILLLPTPSRLTHNGQVDGLTNLGLWGSFEAILLLRTPCSLCSTRLTNGQVDGLPNPDLWESLEGILLLPTPSDHFFQNNINFDQIYI